MNMPTVLAITLDGEADIRLLDDHATARKALAHFARSNFEPMDGSRHQEMDDDEVIEFFFEVYPADRDFYIETIDKPADEYCLASSEYLGALGAISSPEVVDFARNDTIAGLVGALARSRQTITALTDRLLALDPEDEIGASQRASDFEDTLRSIGFEDLEAEYPPRGPSNDPIH